MSEFHPRRRPEFVGYAAPGETVPGCIDVLDDEIWRDRIEAARQAVRKASEKHARTNS